MGEILPLSGPVCATRPSRCLTRADEAGPVIATTATRGLLAALVLLGSSASTSAAGADPARWFSAWSRPQAIAVTGAADALDGGRGPGPLVDQTVRNVLRLSAGGTALRVWLSNRYGATPLPDGTPPLRVRAATIARRATGAALVPGTVRALTFRGAPEVTLAPGADLVSDPVELPVAASDDLAVSVLVESAPVGPQHGASFVTSFVAPAGSGDHTRDVSASAFTERTLSTLLVTGVDVRSSRLQGVVAATGGSVTDGHGSDADQHTDFPSWLARRIGDELPAALQKAVVNNGIGGTTAATACSTVVSGPSVEERVEHDSLRLSGVTHLVVYAGTNDIGGACDATRVIQGYRSVIAQARARGVKVLISTITPRASYTPLQNAEREKVNAWVRGGATCSGECHRSLDFDAVVRDPADHNRIDPRWDSGDGIHPTGEGYRRIAASIPLAALR